MEINTMKPLVTFGVGGKGPWHHTPPAWAIDGETPLRAASYAMFDIEDRRTRLGKSVQVIRSELLKLNGALFRPDRSRAFTSAPVRSHPRRTYDPTRPTFDPEGDYAPSYMAGLSRRNQREWKTLKGSIESFGVTSGLFNEIMIKSFEDAGPFQVHVRRHDKKRKGIWRNIVDVGYGVSQVLPITIDLLREDSPSISLLQQPEVHLHPSAQAALGSLFCTVAEQESRPDKRRQLIVETHSDYIIDRVRMDVRDKKTSLKPEDVSILYFERTGPDVKIHSLSIDERGNVLGAPPSYGQFFLEETNRSIGI